MIMREDHAKISYTAIVCARSLGEHTNIPCAGKIASELLRQGMRAKNTALKVTDSLAGVFKGLGLLHYFLEARYLAASSALKKLGDPDILELACGFTPRGLELAGTAGGPRYVGTDLPEVIRTKVGILAGLKIAQGETYRLRPLNCLSREAFLDAGGEFTGERPIAVLHLGLFAYLTDEEQEILAGNVRAFLARHSPRGYWVSSDFLSDSGAGNQCISWLRKRITRRTGRPVNVFRNSAEFRSFMDRHGFSAETVEDPEVFERANCPRKFRLRKAEALAQFDGNVWVMRLKDR